LTRQLQRHCHNRFTLSLVRQEWQRPLEDECRALDLGWGRLALVREVHLLCHGQPVVFARTAIPSGTLSGPAKRLRNLGARPLGEVLFADPSAQRRHMELARLLPTHSLWQLAAPSTDPDEVELWARRSVFEINQRPLLVSEVFLPRLTS
jgi:chorismate--pyruvate lyase